MFFVVEKESKKGAWFNPEWQPQAQLGDGEAPKAVQPSPNPSDLRLPPIIELQINVTRNLPYLNHAKKGQAVIFRFLEDSKGKK